MHSRLDAIIDDALNGHKRNGGFTLPTLQRLCSNAEQLLITEASLLELDPPINICSDLHGQFHDLSRILQHGGMPPNTSWLFLGDYVDRGPQGLEVVGLLLALKLRFPSNVFLLRGNHETEDISSQFGFLDECTKKMSKEIWKSFINVFNCLPIAAVIGDKFFCIHGGISPQLNDVSQITLINRPTTVPKNGLLTDLLWSDPGPNVSNFGVSERGSATCVYGQAAVNKFLKNNSLKMMIRGHQAIQNGYEFPFPDKSVVTLFSASSLSKGTLAAYMKITPNLTYAFAVLQNEPRKFGVNSANRIPIVAFHKASLDKNDLMKIHSDLPPPHLRARHNSTSQYNFNLDSSQKSNNGGQFLPTRDKLSPLKRSRSGNFKPMQLSSLRSGSMSNLLANKYKD